MKTLLTILIFLMSAGAATATENELPVDYNASQIVTSVVRLHIQADKNRPKHLRELDTPRNQNEFDVTKYFEVFKHISPPEGHVLDYVYSMDIIGGRPFLYLHEAREIPFKTFSDYEKALGGIKKVSETERCMPTRLRLDGSAESFFEQFVFDILAGQFYLYWHANYNDSVIITTADDLEHLFKEIDKDDFGQPLTDEQKTAARKVDLTPRVVFRSDKIAEVSIVIFSKWGGLDRVTRSVARTYPHVFKNIKVEKLVSYDCGMMF